MTTSEDEDLISTRGFVPAPPPADEPDRLAALLRLEMLDTQPEPIFDDLVVLAAHICDCPMALISLIDADRLWFKSSIGIDLVEIPRDLSFCAHALTSEASLLEVPDAQADPRFAGNPLVLGEPRIRFYASALLVGEDGTRYGTVSVIDRVPRELNDTQRDLLQRLAHQAVTHLQTSLARRQAQKGRRTLELLLEAMPDAVITCDREGRLEQFNRTARQWHGIDVRQLPPSQWRDHFSIYADGELLPPERYPLHRALQGESIRDVDILIRTRSQPDRHVRCNGDPLLDDSGAPTGAILVMHDITAARAAERAVAEARARLQSIIDASLDVAIIVTDKGGVVTLFNPGAERLLGYSAEEVVGRIKPSETFHDQDELAERAHEVGLEPSDLRAVAAIAAGGISERGVDTRQWTYVRKDGTTRQVRLSVSALLDARGETRGYVGMATDITPLVEAREAARLSNDRFRSAFTASAQGIALVSLDGRLFEVNQSLCDMLGYPPDEMVNIHFEQLVLPEDVPGDWERIDQLVSGRISSTRLSRRCVRKDGQIIWTIHSMSVVRDSNGEPLHLVVLLLDVTQQKHANDALVESRQFLQALFEHAPDALVVLDANGRITQANRAGRSLMGMVLGDTLQLKGEGVPALPELLARCRATPGLEPAIRLQADVTVRNRDPVPAEISLSLVPQAGIPHWLAIIHDLTEQRAVERLKQEFVSTVSHELRTPLTAVSGALSLVNSGAVGAVPDELREMLDIAEQNSQRLMRLVNDLLDIDKLVAGKMRFAVETIAVRPAIDEALAAMTSYAEPYQVTLECVDSGPAAVLGDPMRVMQVMNNLLSNACKHSPPGSTVRVFYRQEGDEVVIAVKDEGSGVPEAFHARVFDKFAQADSADDRALVGTGLGLAIAKELVERMGGTIGFDSPPGEGACFWFRLPAARPEAGA